KDFGGKTPLCSENPSEVIPLSVQEKWALSRGSTMPNLRSTADSLHSLCGKSMYRRSNDVPIYKQVKAANLQLKLMAEMGSSTGQLDHMSEGEGEHSNNKEENGILQGNKVPCEKGRSDEKATVSNSLCKPVNVLEASTVPSSSLSNGDEQYRKENEPSKSK
ncbi:hypothetical protein KIN20_030346, partial [Parelaphostrongylus tenuis]